MRDEKALGLTIASVATGGASAILELIKGWLAALDDFATPLTAPLGLPARSASPTAPR